MTSSSGHGRDNFSLGSANLPGMSCVAASVHGHQGKHHKCSSFSCKELFTCELSRFEDHFEIIWYNDVVQFLIPSHRAHIPVSALLVRCRQAHRVTGALAAVAGHFMPGWASDQPSTVLAESSCTRTITNLGVGSGEW